MNLERFIEAHNDSYEIALSEIKNGKKRSHWMWYIFPQIKGLGRSTTAIYYSINDINEAKEYYSNDILHNHLIEIYKELLKQSGDIKYIMGYPDYMKLHSSLTLFHCVDKDNELFVNLIDKFYDGKYDNLTIQILEK